MNYRQKLGYTLLGAVIMLTGMTVDSILAPPSIAQHNGTFDEIECSKLIVRGPNGKPAMTLGSNPKDGAVIQLYDQVGTRRFGLLASTLGTFMQLNNSRDRSIDLIAAKQATALTMKNAQGKTMIGITVTDENRTLTLNNPDGSKALGLATQEAGRGSIILFDKAGQVAATLMTDAPIGKHSLTIYEAGQRVWTAPNTTP